jgi:hypothetical protein
MAEQRRQTKPGGSKTKPGRSKTKPGGSEGFRSIKQVGVAYSIGAPLMLTGLLILLITFSIGGDTTLWILGGALTLAGMIAAASGRVI